VCVGGGDRDRDGSDGARTSGGRGMIDRLTE